MIFFYEFSYFKIVALLHDSLIINNTNYNSFNVHTQAML